MTNGQGTRERRPQWRGERRALLVRLPVPMADQVVARARKGDHSLSDTLAELIATGLQEPADSAASGQ